MPGHSRGDVSEGLQAEEARRQAGDDRLGVHRQVPGCPQGRQEDDRLQRSQEGGAQREVPNGYRRRKTDIRTSVRSRRIQTQIRAREDIRTRIPRIQRLQHVRHGRIHGDRHAAQNREAGKSQRGHPLRHARRTHGPAEERRPSLLRHCGQSPGGPRHDRRDRGQRRDTGAFRRVLREQSYTGSMRISDRMARAGTQGEGRSARGLERPHLCTRQGDVQNDGRSAASQVQPVLVGLSIGSHQRTPRTYIEDRKIRWEEPLRGAGTGIEAHARGSLRSAHRQRGARDNRRALL